MFIDSSIWSESAEFSSDVAIIGAGAAGISLALELANHNMSVLLIEGGEWDYSQSSQELYSGNSLGVPLPYGLQGSRLRFMGGSTNCWGGGCGELDEEDFTKKDWVPLSGWPIEKHELAKYYTRTAKFLSINEPVSDAGKAPKEFTVLDGMDFRYLTHTTVVRFKSEFEDQLSASKNIKVLLGANCAGIRFSRTKKAVSKIEVLSLDGKRVLVKTKKYVLACGGIENARLLLNSYEQEIDPCPVNMNTGKYFSDHPIAPCASVILEPNASNISSFDVQAIAKKTRRSDLRIPYFRLPTKIQEQEKVLNAVVQFSMQENELTPEMSSLWRLKNYLQGKSTVITFSDVQKVATHPISLFRWYLDNRSNQKRFAMRFQIEQSPNPNSYVALSDEVDDLGLKKTSLHWHFSPIERRTVDVLCQYVAKQFLLENQGVLKIDLSLRNDKVNLPADLRGGQHHSGTTRMSDSSRTGVVDRDLKVFGIDNLHVLGSSVFPTNGWVNPTFTIIALAFRLADYLVREES